MKRVPYLHYYYTWTWLEAAGLEEIGQVAANHSTWDLEFENLPMESLLLIYADFRVRGERVNGKEVMRICSLEESRDVIFSKLADMTEEKQRRYRTVYAKLRDFEAFLQAHGVSPEQPGAGSGAPSGSCTGKRRRRLAGAAADDLREQCPPDAYHYRGPLL